jgi:hypothetical protein
MGSAFRRYVSDPVATWRTGSSQSQTFTLAVLLGFVGICFAVSLANYALMPLTAYFVWLLLGLLLLRFQWLLGLGITSVVLGVVSMVVDGEITSVRVTAIIAMLISLGLMLFVSSRQHSGLPGPLSEAMLTDLKRRLQSAGAIPQLPGDWRSESAMLASSGIGYGGDFLIADLREDEQTLEVVLVDVCGKGVGAASRALQFSGALGGLIGALPPDGLFAAANSFLLRQQADDAFATAIHVVVDLQSGAYHLTSAGHPPALIWSEQRRTWETDAARGTALGILPRPELHSTSGVLAAGDGLLFYTDGVVESRTTDLESGIRWLQQAAAEAVGHGFRGAPRKIVDQVERGDDDRAVLILHRDPTPVAASTTS